VRWFIDHAFLLVPAQAIVAEHIASFREFPPRQRPGSFSVEQAMEKLRLRPSTNWLYPTGRGVARRVRGRRLTKMTASWLASPTEALSRYRPIGCVLVLLVLLCCSAGQGYAADTLECPEIGAGSVPDLIGDASGGGFFTTDNRVDLANEVNESINRLQVASPNISWSDVQNVLIAAYCRAVARKPGLTSTERWDRMRQFDSVLARQVAANMMPSGSLIIANVPLPPDVYRELKRQAVVSSQTTSQLMTAILARAAGK